MPLNISAQTPTTIDPKFAVCNALHFKPIIHSTSNHPKEINVDATTYMVKLSSWSCEKHNIYLSETGKSYIQWMKGNKNLLEKIGINATNNTIVTGWKAAAVAENKANSCWNTQVSNQDEVDDAFTVYEPKLTALESAIV